MKERLRIALDLVIGSAAHAIPGGNVRELTLQMTPSGLAGSIDFVVEHDDAASGPHADALLADLRTTAPCALTLTLSAVHSDVGLEAAPPIVAKAIVVERSLVEGVYRQGPAEPVVLLRTYRLRFADAAAALWGRHHPCDLFAGKAMRDVLAAHRGPRVEVDSTWPAVDRTSETIFLHLDPRFGASFYDLVVWWVARERGVFTFDPATGKYTLAEAKTADGKVGALLAQEVEGVRLRLGGLAGGTPRVLNSYAAAPTTKSAGDAAAFEGMLRDTLLRTAVAGEASDRLTLEAGPVFDEDGDLEVTFRQLPSKAVTPGSLVSLGTAGGFAESLATAVASYRVVRLSVAATFAGESVEKCQGEPSAPFEVTARAHLEPAASKTPRLPAFRAPTYPAEVEGTVVSESGQTSELTYQVYQDAASRDVYNVKIPLYAEQVVPAPYEPTYVAGSMYVPLQKTARVLVAFDFDRARIERTLEWRDGARVSADTQGVHLLFGKTGTSKTSLLHDYQGDKPVFALTRTNAKDTALLRLEEGTMTLRVAEEKA